MPNFEKWSWNFPWQHPNSPETGRTFNSQKLPGHGLLICSLNGHWLSSSNLLELTWKDHNFLTQFPVCFRLIYSRKVVWPQPDGASGFSMVIQATLVLLVHWYSSISVPKRKLPSIQSRLRTKKGHDWLHGGFLFGTEIGGYQWTNQPV